MIATQRYAAPQVGETYTRGRQLCEALNWPPQFAAVLYGQFVYHLCHDPALARQLAEEIRRLGDARNDDAVRLLGHHLRGIADESSRRFCRSPR
jgi:hypothetical protein